MPDGTLKNLIEHFSKHPLSLANVPEDELGNGYEYLIKQFADDSGHTAQEFYTNRTLVHLMAQMLEPQAGESIYDPTCGTGGMLISCLAEVKRRGGDTRTTGLYGQELINITAAIARMNLVLHGVSDFHIASGNTLAAPAFAEGDRLRTFDVVLANPPYSIKKWNRSAWESDAWGRNFLGTPPQGRADYAFFQHILKSMDPKTGRCAILFPHGVLFRKEEAEMRRKLVETDMVECVLGLGPSLFYNSPMEACVVICRLEEAERPTRARPVHRRGPRDRPREHAELPPAGAPGAHPDAYQAFENEPEFAACRHNRRDPRQGWRPDRSPLRDPQGRPTQATANGANAGASLGAIRRRGARFWTGMDALVDMLDERCRRGGRRCLSEAKRARAGWTTVAFGDVVRQVKDEVDPESPGSSAMWPASTWTPTISAFAAGARLETATLVPLSTCGSSPGTCLYGSRRTYLRKVAVADFEGITANTTYVLEPKDPNVLLPELLPFIMQTEAFNQHSVRESKGSVNPYVNFSDLAWYEFALPPIEEQRRIVAVLRPLRGRFMRQCLTDELGKRS